MAPVLHCSATLRTPFTSATNELPLEVMQFGLAHDQQGILVHASAPLRATDPMAWLNSAAERLVFEPCALFRACLMAWLSTQSIP